MVSSYLPYPLYSGGQVRLYNLLKKLSSKHDITLVCEMRNNQTAEDIAEIKKYCKKVVTVMRKKQWSAGNIIRTAFSTKSFLYNGHRLDQMKEIINKELLTGKYDVIHAETYYIMQNIPKLVSSRIPIVLIEHNIEYLVYARYVKTLPIWIRPLLNIDIAKIRNEEQKAWERADVVAAVSGTDKKVMEEAGFSPEIVPNGVDEEIYKLRDFKKVQDAEDKRILFIGDFRWIQNRDSANWIISEIWPIINQKVPKSKDIKLWFVARNIPKSIKELTDDQNIIFDEESSARPAHELFRSAYLLLSPIRVGGGTSYKIIESMACGTPVLMTPLSAAALGFEKDLQECIGGSADELAEKVLELISDPKKYEYTGRKSRDLILSNFTWDIIGRKLDSIYKNV